MTTKEKAVEWTKEVLSGIGELAEFVLNPIAHAHLGEVARTGYGQWKDKEAFYKRIRERRRVLKARKHAPEKIYHALWRLERQNLIQIKKTSDKFSITVTLKGFLKLLRSGSLFSKQNKWDGKWRIVVFDIPEKYKSTRETLRKYLYAMKFEQIQKSVFVNKRDCLKEVLALMRSCEMEAFTEYFVAEKWGPSPRNEIE